MLAPPDSLTPVATYDAPGAGPFAFSNLWVVWLVGGNQLVAQPRDASVAPRTIATAGAGEQLGRPSIVGQTVVFHRAGRNGSQIRLLDLATNRGSVLRSERRALLSNPTFDGRRILYVRSTYKRQELRLGPLVRRATTPTSCSTAPPRPPAATPSTRRATTATRRLPGRQGAEALRAAAGRRHRHALEDRAQPDHRLRHAAAATPRGHDGDDSVGSALVAANVNGGLRGGFGPPRRHECQLDPP